MPIGVKLVIRPVWATVVGDFASSILVQSTHFMHNENGRGQFDLTRGGRIAAFGQVEVQIEAAIPLDALKGERKDDELSDFDSFENRNWL